MTDEKRFYVYVYYFTDTDEVFYVGKGTGDRVKQLSGRNKQFADAVLSGRPMKRVVLRNLTEQEAFAIETKTINQCKADRHPLANRQHVEKCYKPKKRGEKHAENPYEKEMRQLGARYSREKWQSLVCQ